MFRLSWAILKPSWGHLRSKRLLEGPGAKENFGQTDFGRKVLKNQKFFVVFVKSVVGLLQNKLLGDPSGPKWVTNLALVGHFWDHFLNHFLVTFWTTFGDHFGAHFRTRSAKEGAR